MNGLKKFASERGRVVIVGENGGYMGVDGIVTENKLLADLGAQLTHQGGCDVSEGGPADVVGAVVKIDLTPLPDEPVIAIPY